MASGVPGSEDRCTSPGDALRCKARTEMAYGFDNELITERYDGHAYAGSFFSLAKRPSLIRGFRTGGFLVLFEEEHNFLKIKKSVGQSCWTVNLSTYSIIKVKQPKRSSNA